MAKQTGLGDQLFIGGFNVGGDIQSIGGLSTPRETLDSTAITQSAMARLYGKRDGSAEFTSYFNDAPGEVHEVLKALPRTDVQVMYLRGQGAGNAGIGMVGKQLNYDGNRGDDGAFMFATTVQANGYGIDWGVQLTDGIQTDASATNSAGVSLGSGSTAFGLQAYVQVFSIGSGTATIKLQESSDNGVGDAWVDVTGGGFTAVTASGAERIQTTEALTVERYLRVVTTGVFTNLEFAVIVNRNNGQRAI